MGGVSTDYPSAGIELKGNYLNGASVYSSIKIGDLGSSSSLNTIFFDNLQYGINSTNTNLTVNNCIFQKPVGVGVGINVVNTNQQTVDISSYPSDVTNAFFDMSTAIIVSGSNTTTISNCDIRSSQNKNNVASDGSLIGNYGININNHSFTSIDVTDNRISNVKYAIQLRCYKDRAINDPQNPNNPLIGMGSININNNYISKLIPNTTTTTGNEYVEYGINLENLYVSTDVNKTITCQNNHIEAINGIRASNWHNNVIIENNPAITLIPHPTNPNYAAFGICLEGGYSFNEALGGNRIVNNIVTGFNKSQNSTGILLNQQSGTEIGCNTVSQHRHGFRFEGTNLLTKFSDNYIYPSNQYGVIFAHNGQIDKQGNEANTTPTADDVCTSNNNWITTKSNTTWNPADGSYMMYCDNTSIPANSPFVVRINSPSNTGLNPEGACWSASGSAGTYYTPLTIANPNGTLIYPLTLDGTNCLRCKGHPLAQRIANIPHLLDEIAAGTVLLPNDNPDDRLMVMQQQLYELARRQPNIAQNSSDIQQFIYENQWSSLDFIYYAGYYASTGNIDMVGNLLNYWTPDGTPLDDNYKKYYEWLTNMYNDPNWSPNLTDVLTLANKCPITNGTIVYAARNLYNAITSTINNFDNSCDDNQAARGIEKMPTEFIRLKQPKTKAAIEPINQVVTVYPNPAKTVLNITCNNMKQLEVVDAIGNTAIKKQLNGISNIQLNVESILQKGLYLIKIIDCSNKIYIAKFIKE